MYFGGYEPPKPAKNTSINVKRIWPSTKAQNVGSISNVFESPKSIKACSGYGSAKEWSVSQVHVAAKNTFGRTFVGIHRN